MNKVFAWIGLPLVAMQLGIAGGLMLSFLTAGIELQPLWVKISGVVTVCVLLLNAPLILFAPKSRARQKHLERMCMAIASLFITPMFAGFCLIIIPDLQSGSNLGGGYQNMVPSNDSFYNIALKIYTYIPFVINCWYVLLEGVIPAWDIFKSKES